MEASVHKIKHIGHLPTNNCDGVSVKRMAVTGARTWPLGEVRNFWGILFLSRIWYAIIERHPGERVYLLDTPLISGSTMVSFKALDNGSSSSLDELEILGRYEIMVAWRTLHCIDTYIPRFRCIRFFLYHYYKHFLTRKWRLQPFPTDEDYWTDCNCTQSAVEHA